MKTNKHGEVVFRNFVMPDDHLDMPVYANDTENLVIYEWPGDKSPKQWLDLMIEFLDIIKTPPDFVEMAIADKSRRVSSKSFRRQLDELAVESITSISANWLEDKKDLSRPKMIVIFKFGERRKVQLYSLNSFAKEEMIVLFSKLSTFLDIEYGIIYEMPRNSGPYFYASGIGAITYDDNSNRSSNSSRGEADNIAEFGKVFRSSARNDTLTRKFRDIYVGNLINGAHLANRISGMTLQEFITSNHYGKIIQLSGSTYLWKFDGPVPVECRRAMIEAGLTISKY